MRINIYFVGVKWILFSCCCLIWHNTQAQVDCVTCLPPEFVLPLPGNIIVECDQQIPPMISLGFSSDCDNVTNGSVLGTDFPFGTIICDKSVSRTWEYTDICGNTISHTQTISIFDNIPPVIPVPSDVSYDCLGDVPLLDDIMFMGNCGYFIEAIGTETNDGLECPLTITRQWTAIDSCFNSSTETQTIIVEHTVFQCENNIVSDTCIYSLPCNECPSSFAPIPGREYVISAWVKEENSLGAFTYSSANISLFFEGANVTLGPYYGKDEIIDGWQRIEEEFTVPSNAFKIKIQLNNADNTKQVYFDDIRVYPFDATMISYVYDPITYRLWAVLDERNYAECYEYDEEGALIRVKKETSRGKMTVQEGRNALQKQ